MRVRPTMLPDGRYFIFYEFLRSERRASTSERGNSDPARSLTETKDAGV